MPTVTSKKFSWFTKLSPAKQDEAWRERRKRFREQNEAIAAAASAAFADTMTNQVTRGAELSAQQLLVRVRAEAQAKLADVNRVKLDVSA